MHIGIDGTTWRNPRGFGRFTRDLVRALAARDSGMSYTMVCDSQPDEPVPANVEVLIADPPRGQDTANRLGMHRAASGLDCDVFFYPTIFSFFPMMNRVPKVVVIHDTIPERYPELIFPTALNRFLWTTKMRLAKLQATRFNTCSQSSVRDLQEILGIPASKIDVTTMAAAPVFRPITDQQVITGIRDRLKIPDSAKILTYLGGFNRHKNVIRLIEAMPEILRHQPDTYLAIVGQISGERFWDNIDELQTAAARDDKTRDRIIFTGRISDEDLAGLLNATYALVHPALYEGFGFPPVEAMACGTPVLASNASSIPEVVGDAGLLFDPNNSADIARQAVRLLSDEDLRAMLAARTLNQSAKFTWDRAAEMTEESFRRAIS